MLKIFDPFAVLQKPKMNNVRVKIFAKKIQTSFDPSFMTSVEQEAGRSDRDRGKRDTKDRPEKTTPVTEVGNLCPWFVTAEISRFRNAEVMAVSGVHVVHLFYGCLEHAFEILDLFPDRVVHWRAFDTLHKELHVSAEGVEPDKGVELVLADVGKLVHCVSCVMLVFGR